MASTSPGPAATAESLAVLDAGLNACTLYGRPDLAEALVAARERISRPGTRVLVVGEFKQGKSSVVNALLNVRVCPVDDDIATSAPTVVRHAEQVEVTVVIEPEEEGAAPTTEVIALQDLASFVTEAGNPANARRVREVEVGLPRSLLASGLSLVDTPGVGGLGSSHNVMTLAALSSADAVLLVSDASQELTEPEVAFLRRAAQLCPNLAVLLTKTDLYPSWRAVLALDEEHLERQGFGGTRVLPVSSQLRLHALQHDERDLNAESGFAALTALLRSDVIDDAERRSVAAAASAASQVAGHLVAQLEVERRLLADPSESARLERELTAARDRVDRLRSESARWQITLNDAVADLSSDVDHDLRGRTRALLQEAEARIDDGDPADWWDEFTTWLQARAAEQVSDNYLLLARRSEEVVATVAGLFAAAEEEIDIGVEVMAPTELLDQVQSPEGAVAVAGSGMRTRATTVLGRSHTAIRGSYGAYSMFTVISGMVGLAALTPAVAGLTVLLGRKSVRDEKQRELGQRRQQAKAAARKYVDEISFEVGKSSRDALRRVQRQLRDDFAERAECLQRTVGSQLEAAERAAGVSGDGRRARLAQVEAELERVQRFQARAAALAGGDRG